MEWPGVGGGRWAGRDVVRLAALCRHSARPGLLAATTATSMQVGAKKVLSHKAMHQYLFKDLALIRVHGASGQRGVTGDLQVRP